MSEQQPESGNLVVAEENKPAQQSTTQPQDYVEEYLITEGDSGGSGGGIRGCLWPIVAIVAIIFLPPWLFAAFTIVTGTSTFDNVVDSVTSAVSSIFSPKPTTITLNPSQTLVSRIKPMGELVSNKVELAMANIDVDINRGGPNLCGMVSTYVSEATFLSGVDLSNFSEDSITVLDDRIVIQLPAPQLTSCDITYIEEYKRTPTACPVDSQNLRFMAEYTAMYQFRADILGGEMLDDTQKKAGDTLQGIAEALTDKPVEIRFAEYTTVYFPPTCEPGFPRGWTYDEATGKWTDSN